jgi:hypothetical protein
MSRFFSAILLAMLLPLTGFAQTRVIPDSAKLGSMTHVQGMLVNLDGKRVFLAPGAQIRSPRNLIIVPTQLPPGSPVKYQIDGNGQVFRVWILSKEEAARTDGRH